MKKHVTVCLVILTYVINIVVYTEKKCIIYKPYTTECFNTKFLCLRIRVLRRIFGPKSENMSTMKTV